jgi:hypothetical protein
MGFNWAFKGLHPCGLAQVYRRIEGTVLFASVVKNLLFNMRQRTPKLESLKQIKFQKQ